MVARRKIFFFLGCVVTHYYNIVTLLQLTLAVELGEVLETVLCENMFYILQWQLCAQNKLLYYDSCVHNVNECSLAFQPGLRRHTTTEPLIPSLQILILGYL